MKLNSLQKALIAAEFDGNQNESNVPSELEVYADSLSEALKVASDTLYCSISDLEYEIVSKGKTGFIGIGRLPYQIIVRKSANIDSKWTDLEDLSIELDVKVQYNEFGEEVEAPKNGKCLIRVYNNGVFVILYPPTGNGSEASIESANEQLRRLSILEYDKAALQKAFTKKIYDPVKISSFSPRPGAESTLAIEISNDEMEASITITSPRPGGRHLTVKEIVHALKKMGIVYGISEEKIADVLDNDKYNELSVVAQGQQVVNGRDGFVDYKVKIEKTPEFKEDEAGKVDFFAKDLIENVVQGQVLAELLPPEKGVPGRTLFNKILPATDGKPGEMKPGKGTILSENGSTLIAEKNGQVVYLGGRINVEDIYVINGDVGLDTGNIMFLGSVTVRGSVVDNMEVKAAGNIEIAGSVQKSHIEAEGEIIVRQGIMGRDGAVIESTTGSIFAKFVQNCKVNVEKDVVVAEGIMHSKVYAGGKILCNGKRAQIVGGEIMAGDEIRVKQLGAQASTPTLAVAGTNPKILQQIQQLEAIEGQAKEKLEKIEQNIRTLTAQKSAQKEEFTASKNEMLTKMISAKEKLKDRLDEAESEKKQLKEYLTILASSGKIHVEKTLYPGVKVIINGAEFSVSDEYHNVTLIEENGYIKIVPYQDEGNKMKKRKPQNMVRKK